jgi:hypothetical protein
VKEKDFFPLIRLARLTLIPWLLFLSGYSDDALVNGRISQRIPVQQGLPEKVFAEWKRQFLTRNRLSEGMFDKRIEISNVQLVEGPIYVWCRIDYVFVLDWVRLVQAASVDLGEYPLDREPDQEVIARAVRLAIRETDQLTIPKVVSRLKVERAFQSCEKGMQPNWSDIGFENLTGRLLMWGFSTIDKDENQCKRAAVDLATGEVAYCHDGPCWVSIHR